MDDLLRQATARLRISTQELSTRNDNSERESHVVVGQAQRALHQLLQPLDETTYTFLLDNNETELPNATDDNDAEPAHGSEATGDTEMVDDTEVVDDTEMVDDAEPTGDAEQELESDSDSVVAARHAEYVFVIGKTPCYAWEWLGKEYTEWIEELHDIGPLEELPSGLITQPRLWQLVGAKKLLHMLPRWRGAILADEMGLGKTLTAILVSEALKVQYEGFTLVVTTKSCVTQWRDEIFWNFKQGSRPRGIILEDPKVSANDLLDQDFDYVICTYQFARSRWAELQRYVRAFEELEPHTKAAAKHSDLFKGHQNWLHSRPICALHSPVYSQVGKPIKMVILDEVQLAKNEESSTWHALQNIQAEFKLLLSGTIFANRWSDGYGPISFLKNHPFDTRAKFRKAFAKQEGTSAITDPSPIKENRYVKFLQGCVLSRPSELLKLQDLKQETDPFYINNLEICTLVCGLMKRFFVLMRKANLSTLADVNDGKACRQKAIYLITMAQQLVANQYMLRPKDRMRLEATKAEAVKDMDDFAKEFSDLDPRSREFHLKAIDYMDKYYVPPSKKRKLSSVKEYTSKRARIHRIDLLPKDDDERGHGHGNHLDSEQVLTDYDKQDDDGNNLEESPDCDVDEDGEPELGGEEVGDKEAKSSEEYESPTVNKKDRQEWLQRLKILTMEELQSPRIKSLVSRIRTVIHAHPGEKIIIFSKFLKFHDILERVMYDQFPGSTCPVYRFDGTVQGVLRQSRIRQFSDTSGSAVILITAGCGGAGLNLTAASHVILCEPWWRESDELQAIARAHRLGQTRIVHVYRLYGVDSMVDKVMIRMSSKKALTSNRIMDKLRRPDNVRAEIPEQAEWEIEEKTIDER